jgi:putative peptide zinc metalloprotease protein
MSAAQTLQLPALRQELRIERGAALVNGAPGWTLFDPVRHLFFQLGEIEFAIFSNWANGRIDRVAGELAAKGMDAADIDAAFGRTLEFSLSNSLTQKPLGDAVATYQQQRTAARKAWWKWMLDNYLFIRIPLVRPSAFLERTLPRVAIFWSRAALTFFALLALLGLYLVSRQWDAFTASFLYFFSWQGLVAYGAGLFAVKIIHELGHAYTATRFGARVPTMGVSLMVLMPMLYTDTTGAWRLRSRKQRLMIDCAGVSAELMVASVSTLLWVMLPDGPVRSVFFVLATSSWVMSLVINLNPFMRFDGYYVLSDLLDVPNLQPRAFALGRWKLRELLFDLGDPPPEAMPAPLRRGLIVYAWLTWLYRLVLFVGIALLVYHLFFKLLGIILFVVEIGVFVAKPVISELKIWASARKRIGATQRGRRWPWILSIVALVAVLPLDRHVSAPAVLAPVGVAPVVAGDPARIDRLFVKNGQSVKAGMVLMELSAPELQSAAAATRVRITQLQAQYDRAAADNEDLSNRQVIERELAREQDALAGLDRRAAKLVLRAPISGVVTDLSPDHHPGRWLNGAEVLARILTPGDFDVQAYVSERDIERITVGGLGRFIADDPAQPSRRVKLVERSLNAIEHLDQPLLASSNGGAIAVAVDGKTDALKTRKPLYRIRLLAAKAGGGDASIRPVTGEVQIGAESRSLAGWLLADLLSLFRQEATVTG